MALQICLAWVTMADVTSSDPWNQSPVKPQIDQQENKQQQLLRIAIFQGSQQMEGQIVTTLNSKEYIRKQPCICSG